MVSGINKIVNKQYGKREKRETRFDAVLKGLISNISNITWVKGVFSTFI